MSLERKTISNLRLPDTAYFSYGQKTSARTRMVLTSAELEADHLGNAAAGYADGCKTGQHRLPPPFLRLDLTVDDFVAVKAFGFNKSQQLATSGLQQVQYQLLKNLKFQ